MNVPRKYVAAVAIATMTVVLVLVTVAAALLAAQSGGATRGAWALISAAALLCTVVCAGGAVALPVLVRSARYSRQSRQRVAELWSQHRRTAAEVASIRKAVDEMRVWRSTLPDTARTHKLLEVSAANTVGALTRELQVSSKSTAELLREEVRAGVARTERATGQQSRQLYGQLDGLAALYATLRPGTGLPPLLAEWAIGADLAAYLVRHVRRVRPDVIVELGSGVSTLLLALAVRELGAGRVTAIEHDEGYADRTAQLLDAYDAGEWAEVRVAPLVPTEIDGETYSWYDLSAVRVPDRINLMLVDGPPGNVGPNSRFPAVPRLRSRLADDAVVVLDDAGRADEQACAERWCDRYGLRLVSTIRDTTGTAVLVPVADVSGTAPTEAPDAG